MKSGIKCRIVIRRRICQANFMLLFAEDVNISDYSNAVSLSCLDIKEAFIEYSSQRKLLFKSGDGAD